MDMKKSGTLQTTGSVGEGRGENFDGPSKLVLL